MEDRIIEIEEENKKLTIKQNLDIGYAGEVWDASLVLIYFMIKQNNLFKKLTTNPENKTQIDIITESKKIIFIPKNKTILELGSATGVNGLICGIFGAKKLILTDKGGCCKLLKVNYDLNKNEFQKEFECEIKELDWTVEKDRENIPDKNNIDYIIGSDLVWNPKLREPLANTIKYFLGFNKNLKCFFSFEIRDREIKYFFELFEKDKYKVEKIPEFLYDDTYKSDEIIIVRIANI